MELVDEVMSAVPHRDMSLDEYLYEQKLESVLTRAITQLVKEKPTDPLHWLATYLRDNNPHKPKIEELSAGEEDEDANGK